MKILAICLTIAAAITLLTSCGNFSSWQKSNRRIITIGSGSKSAMFYPVATAICEIFNKYNQDKGVICKPVLSKGAEYNLEAVENGEFDIGIAQANLQHDAYNGLGKFKGNPHKNLRTLFRIHDEYLTIIAKKDSNIKNFSDLRGKKVNIGAGTITCNYDGKKKNKTKISDGAFIGSNTSLIAPIKIGKRAIVGAGSALTKNVKNKSLAFTRANQIEIKNYKKK